MLKYTLQLSYPKQSESETLRIRSLPPSSPFVSPVSPVAAFEKLLKILYKEASTNERASVFAGMTMAVGDNAVYWILNTNAAAKISEWLNVSGRGEEVLKYALLLNGAASITAINYYSASLLTQQAIKITGRIPLIPDYYRWFMAVIFMATCISSAACSGAVGLTYELYKDKPGQAIFFSTTAAIVNVLIANFFAIQLFKKNPLITLNEDQIHKLSDIKFAFNCFGHNLSCKSDVDYNKFILDLKEAIGTKHSNGSIVATPFNQELQDLFSLPTDPDPESNNNINTEATPLLDSQINSSLSYVSRMGIRAFSGLNASAAMWLYYHVGKLAFAALLVSGQGSEDSEEKTGIPELEAFVGACMSTVAAINVFYSTEHLLTHFFTALKKESLIRLLKHDKGKSILITLIGFLSSLSAIDLVSSYSLESTPKQLSTLSYIGGVSQLFLLNTNALNQTPPWFAFSRFCDEVKHSFYPRQTVEKKKMLRDSLNDLGEQISCSSGQDIENIHDSLAAFNLLPMAKRK